MAKVKDVLKEFFSADQGEDDFVLPLDESGKLIRPMGTVKAVQHSFRTRSRGKDAKGAPEQAEIPDMLPLDDESRALLELANAVRDKAYAKYSEFRVGAALVAESGQVYLGVNIENAAYPAGICAERSAICAAISAGERSFSAIAIVGGEKGEPCYPCGICRQVLSEFCGPDFPVILADGVYSLGGLLPHSFEL